VELQCSICEKFFEVSELTGSEYDEEYGWGKCTYFGYGTMYLVNEYLNKD
jgi:hypothetical protein